VCKFAGITYGGSGRVFGILHLKFLQRYDFNQPVKKDLDARMHELVGCIRYDAVYSIIMYNMLFCIVLSLVN
jgi:hypothetical protein